MQLQALFFKVIFLVAIFTRRSMWQWSWATLRSRGWKWI